MTVRQLLASIDSAELSEWMVYLSLEREGKAPVSEEEAWKKAFNAHG